MAEVLAAALLGAGLSACAVYPPENYGVNKEQAYTLDAGDELRVIVFEADNLPQSFKVSASGHIPCLWQVPSMCAARRCSRWSAQSPGGSRATSSRFPKSPSKSSPTGHSSWRGR